MIGRKRVNRILDMRQGQGKIVDLPPGWQFTIECPHHGKFVFDFTQYRESGRELLAAQMRDAIWSLRHELIGKTLHNLRISAITRFWAFLDDLDAAGKLITKLSDIDEYVIREFLSWLQTCISKKGINKGLPLALSSRKSSYTGMKTLLINRQKKTPDDVSRNLRFPKNPFPLINFLTTPREAYSESEHRRILTAINNDLRLIDEKGDDALPPLQILAVHILALGVATGRNSQSILDLRRDSLRHHPLDDREILVTEKRRGYSTHVTAYRKKEVGEDSAENIAPIPRSVGDYIRFLQQFTAHLLEEASPADRDYVLLWRVTRMGRKGKVVRLVADRFNKAAAMFVKRHGLLDDQGNPLSLNLSRCRPTFGTRLYERTRDIRKVQVALGHSDPQITARHYVKLPEDSERNHSFVGQAMVGWATSEDSDKIRQLAADGQIPLLDARELLRGGYNTLIARCRNPFREIDRTCAKYLPCFTCPQMVVFEEDLWRLYSFYYKLLFERVKMNSNDWLKTYGPVINIIDVEIAPQFDAALVEFAKKKAQESPHPAWPRGAENE